MFARLIRFTFAAIALALLSAGVYVWYGERELDRWLREQAAALGCTLDYGAAEVGWPGHFVVKNARLSDCGGARWGARLTHADATVKPLSLLWGPVFPVKVALTADSLRWGGLSLHGPLDAHLENEREEWDARIETETLVLKQNERELANSAAATMTIKIPHHTSAPRGIVRFTLRSVAVPSWGLVAREPMTGLLEARYEEAGQRLEVADATIRASSCSFGEQSLAGELEVSRAFCSQTQCSGLGRVRLNGEDTVGLIEQLRAPEALTFALSGLKGVPFELRSGVTYARQTWSFDELTLSADDASISGSASLRGSERQGALRALYRGVSLGVQLSGDQSRVIFDPPSDWAGLSR